MINNSNLRIKTKEIRALEKKMELSMDNIQIFIKEKLLAAAY